MSTGRRYRPVKPPPRALAALFCLVLTGCGLFGDDYVPPCPRAVVLADAQTVTAFRPGPGRDLTDILHEGTITGLASGCEYDDGIVDFDIDIGFELAIGPASPDGVGHWEYFVVVVDPDQRRVAKRTFTIDLQFEQAAFRTELVEQVSQRIAYAPWPDASGYRIFIGFQLTREQLDYLRSRAQRQ